MLCLLESARTGLLPLEITGVQRIAGENHRFHKQEAADGGYVASVPALPGCHTQGETPEEAERNVAEAVELYLESLVAHGESIPEEGSSFQGRISSRPNQRSVDGSGVSYAEAPSSHRTAGA